MTKKLYWFQNRIVIYQDPKLENKLAIAQKLDDLFAI
jgi:hypothetical protein